METHDGAMLGIIIVLLLSSITFASAYFYTYNQLSIRNQDLISFGKLYNDLSWQYYYNCTPKNSSSYSYSNYTYFYNNSNSSNDSNYFYPYYHSYDIKEFTPKCTIETKIIYHHTWLEGGMEYYSTCLRCADLNKSIAPGNLKNGEWICPANTYY